MIAFTIINACGRLMLTVIVVLILSMFRERLNIAQRLGLGLAGGGSFLTAPVILQPYQTPFEGWAVGLLTWGMVIFLSASGMRYRKHSVLNDEQVRRSREYLKSRGKL